MVLSLPIHDISNKSSISTSTPSTGRVKLRSGGVLSVTVNESLVSEAKFPESSNISILIKDWFDTPIGITINVSLILAEDELRREKRGSLDEE